MSKDKEETNVTHLPMKWADGAMFEQEPISELWTEEHGVLPKIHLLWMTPAPLSAMAAMNLMYEGKPVRRLTEVSASDARRTLEDMTHTHLPAPMEAVKFHFLIDGGDRAFQQQLTRQRTAVYAGESLRFAVVDDLVHGTTLPPTVFGTKHDTDGVGEWPSQYVPSNHQDQRWRDLIDTHAAVTSDIYNQLVNDGMPAEDARSILPLSTATRIEYVTDLRNLVHHAGNRLCTQAQYHWRLMFNQIVKAISDYPHTPNGVGTEMFGNQWAAKFGWEFRELSQSRIFRPACYQLGHCPFKASIDRPCKIRDRVDAFASYGVPSDEWSEGKGDPEVGPTLDPIDDSEWLMDPSAARVKGRS